MAPIDDIAKIIREAIAGALEDRKDELTAIAVAGGKAAAPNTLGDVGDIAKVLSLLLDVITVLGPEFALPVEIVNQATGQSGKEGRSFGIGYFLGYTLFQFATPYLNYITHALADAAQSEIFDPQTAATLVAKGIIPLSEGRSEAHGGGFDDPHFTSMIEGAVQHPDVTTLNTLRNLDLISDAQVVAALKRHGFTDEYLAPLQGLRRYLLSPADLALANLRGNMADDVMLGYAKQLGITQDDMAVLIENTGEPPGPEQLMEALRRGFIDDARFVRGIRQSRVRNEWVDVERMLAQSPMTTSDAVRAVVENYLTPEQGAEIARMNGLLPEHWSPLLESWGRPPSHEQMMQLYYRGKATLEDVRQAMRESDMKNKYVDDIIELGRRLVPERTIVSMVDHGVITHDEGIGMLKELGFNEVDAAKLVKLGAAQRTTTAKHLSRTDIVAMYEDRLIPKREAGDKLHALGYTDADATTMLDLADYKARTSLLKATARGIEATYKAKHINATQAKAELVKAGYDSGQAAQLVDEWTTLHQAQTRGLTEAQILSFAGAKLITVDDARARLLAMGLVSGDVDLLLQYHGLVPAPGQAAR